MAAGFLDIIKEDLKDVNSIIEKSLKIRTGSICDFAHIEGADIIREFHPAVIVLVGHMVDLSGPKLTSMAAIVQFIYMAVNVHFRISDENLDPSETDIRDGAQYPVLVGDYLYGRFFTTLCAGDMAEYLDPLAKVICEINTGGMLRTQGCLENNRREEVIAQESAKLIQEGCRLVSQLADMSEEVQSNLTNLGFDIGMGFGFLERGCASEAKPYLTKAITVLAAFPQNAYRDALQAFLSALRDGEIRVPTKMYGKVLNSTLTASSSVDSAPGQKGKLKRKLLAYFLK